MPYNPDDVVRIRHPFLGKRGWRIIKQTPSLHPDITLYRVQLLNSDGTETKMRPITVVDNFVIEKIGRYPTWPKKRGNKNSRK